MIRVLVADDQALVRSGIRMLLDLEEDIEVVGEAADGDDALRAAIAARPDVVLMDINMPGVCGIEATRRIAADESFGTKVLMLTSFESDENLFQALRAGASGFLVKDTDPAELVNAIRVVAGGEALLSPSVTRRLIAEFASRPEERRRSPDELRWLTEREREVMALVAAGLTNDEIAERLVVTRATAKTHVSRAMRKLHVHDRAQLVVLAYETGLVRPAAVAAARYQARAKSASGKA
jgi:RNA polymerase sigma factor (sigma-70 family)